jgi:hypothetical protein
LGLAKGEPQVTIMNIEIAKELTFFPDSHTYFVGAKEVPSVTTILKRSDDHPDYSAVPDFVLKRAGDIGTLVHETVERWCKSEGLLTTDDESANVYLDGFVEFVRENDFVPLYSEVRLYDPDLWYAGTVDLVCLVNGVLSVVDIKTTNRLNMEYVELQLAAYQNLIEIWGDDRISDRAVIWLKKTGTYRYVKAENPIAFLKFRKLIED